MKKKTKNGQQKTKLKKKSKEEESSLSGDKATHGYERLMPLGYLVVAVLAIWLAQQRQSASIPKETKGATISQLGRLFRRHCRKPHEYCLDTVQVDDRALKVNQATNANTHIITISRSSQIWDIDALRSPLIQNLNLLSARHNDTSNQPLNNIAYLAAYLALRNKDDAYLQYLPTHTDFAEFHPVAMEEDYLKERLGGEQSHAYLLIMLIKRKIQSEYKAFCSASTEFQERVSQDTYTESRINVMSRSFHLSQTNVELTTHEQYAFQHLDTVNSYSMVPLLDALDHQNPGNNIAWGRMTPEGDIGIRTTERLKPGQVLYNKYSSTESQDYMFAIYGFLIGNEPVSQSIDAYHRTVEPMIESPAGWQKRQLLQYLAHDDGYSECIESSTRHPTEYAFKRLKLLVLEMIANNPKYWVVRLPSRRNHPPAFDSNPTDQDFGPILQTCRLLAMTHRDYQGDAHQILRNALSQGNLDIITLQQRNDDDDVMIDLEIRAWTWMLRLARHKRNQYDMGLTEMTERISSMEVMSRDWTVAQIQFGEIQSLEYIMDHAYGAIQRLRRNLKKGDDGDSSLMIREDACPFSTVLPLLA
ncbi:unnamed protein product [Cylindrotheca closterium]|uniref:SET domain-containing protein n=1 Tax=Cylindrotheca closterium TaxID=2856 RepID=A0AAD2FRJ3_9STRA|nr:unnamed protein product [Cylindrotheca closterium]